MTTGRTAKLGLGLGLLYALVALLTHHLAPSSFRPLYDGFAPPAPYRWVNPPPEFARDNQQPDGAERELPLGSSGNEVANVTTGDAQAIAALESGSVPPRGGELAVKLRLAPLDPGTLGPLPDGLRPQSNAYQLTLVYQPSGAAIATLARPGTIALTAAAVADTFLYSPDGRVWEVVASRPFGGSHGRFGELRTPGYFVVASPPVAPTSVGDEDGGTSATPFLVTLAAVAPMVAFVLLLQGRDTVPGTAAKPANAFRPRRPAPKSGRAKPKPPRRRT